MPTLRSLRLIGSVEAGTTNGAQLEVLLGDAGRRAELAVLLASRGQSRRMAGNTLTVAAIVASPQATNVVFAVATAQTAAACEAVVASPVAMQTVAASPAALAVAGGNAIAFGLLTASTYYEPNIKTILANYSGLTPTNYASTAALIADPVAVAAVIASAYGMSALVASPDTVTLMAANGANMALVASDPEAIATVAAKTAIMGTIANSVTSMTEINSRAGAVTAVANKAGAISAVSASAAGWASYKAGPFFANNLAAICANLVGLNPALFPTLASIISDPVALALVAANTNAVVTMATDNAAMTTLANSANLSIMLNSATAIAVLGPNTTAMTQFLGVSGAWATLFASSTAKGHMVISTALVNVIAANGALITYLTSLSKVAQPQAVPDGVSGVHQAFDSVIPLPAKVLTLTAKEVGIAATFSSYSFSGTVLAGATAGATISLTSTINLAHVAGYTGLTWDFKGIGITAATLPIIRYVDMS